ncbi:hypothetical protein [Streptomyces alfalfae]|nr:hypothetical protein [Streptomyces alfalfae]
MSAIVFSCELRFVAFERCGSAVDSLGIQALGPWPTTTVMSWPVM